MLDQLSWLVPALRPATAALVLTLVSTTAHGQAVGLLRGTSITTSQRDVVLSPDSRFAMVRAGASSDGVTFYRLSDGVRTALFNASTSPADGALGFISSDSVAIRGDGTRAVAVGGASSDAVMIFDTSGATPTLMQSFNLVTGAHDLAIASDGRFAMVRAGASAGAVTFYQLSDATLKASFTAFTASPGVDSAVISADSTRAVALGGAGVSAVAVFNTSGTTPSLLDDHVLSTAPHDAAIAPDNRFAIVRAGASADGVTFLRMSDGGVLATFAASTAPPAAVTGIMSSDSVAVSADSTRAVALGAAGADSVMIFDTSAAAPVLMQSFALTTLPHDVALSPDNRFVMVRAGASLDGVSFYQLSDATLLASFNATTAPVSLVALGTTSDSVAIRGDSTRAVAVGGASALDGVQIFDTAPAVPVLLKSFALSTAANDVTISSDGVVAAVRAGAGGPGVVFYNLQTGTALATFSTATGPPPVNSDSIAISADNRRAVAVGGANSADVFALSPAARPVEILVGSFAHNVRRYDALTGSFLGELVPPGLGGLAVSLGVTIGPDGHLYVSSRDTDAVLRFDGATGVFLDTFASGGGLDEPTEILFGADGHLYVSSFGSGAVLRYHGATGAFLGTFTSGGTQSGSEGFTFGPDGHLYVTSPGTDTVVRYDGTSGVFLDTFASGGGLDGPTGVTFGPDGHLYVGSIWTDQVLRYHGTTGGFLGVVASGGLLVRPIAVRFGPDGLLYVTSQGMDSILRYNTVGDTFIDVLASGSGLDGWTWFTFRDEALIFIDGFESGDSGRWSATVPVAPSATGAAVLRGASRHRAEGESGVTSHAFARWMTLDVLSAHRRPGLPSTGRDDGDRTGGVDAAHLKRPTRNERNPQ